MERARTERKRGRKWKRTADGINWKRLRAAFLATIQEFLAVITENKPQGLFIYFPRWVRRRGYQRLNPADIITILRIFSIVAGVNYGKPETTAVRRANNELAIRRLDGRSEKKKENLPESFAQSDARHVTLLVKTGRGINYYADLFFLRNAGNKRTGRCLFNSHDVTRRYDVCCQSTTSTR